MTEGVQQITACSACGGSGAVDDADGTTMLCLHCVGSGQEPKPLLMDHPLNADWCCLSCDAVFAFGELVGDLFPPGCPRCGETRTCSVEVRDACQ